MLGGIGGLIFFTAVRRPSSNYESYNYNRPAASSSPYVYNANSEPPPSAPGARNRNSPKAPISGGVLNGKATSLPKPAYPAIARAAHASGTVTVQVTVDESGKVISARAVSGHPLLQAAAVQAAYGARFSPTLLSGQPVKVTGVLTYNFVAE
jgi:protein TonB